MDNNSLSKKIEQLINVILALERKPRDFGPAQALTTTQIHAIQVIGEQETITMHELATSMNLSKSTITQVVNVLLKKKCITRSISVLDKRRTVLGLTDKGYQAYMIHKNWHRELIELFTTRFNSQELSTLAEFLDKVTTLFEQKIS